MIHTYTHTRTYVYTHTHMYMYVQFYIYMCNLLCSICRQILLAVSSEHLQNLTTFHGYYLGPSQEDRVRMLQIASLMFGMVSNP